MGLSTKNLQRLRSKYNWKSFNSQLDGTELDIEEIIKLVEMHGGTYIEQSEVGKGKEVILTFPYFSGKEEQNTITSVLKNSNVYPFIKK